MPIDPVLADATALRDETVLRRVRQSGSARDGLGEWQLQRKTALALIPLGLYFVGSMVRLATSDEITAAQWMASPVPALLTILFVIALFMHAVVGLRSVLLDYVHTRLRLVAAGLVVRASAPPASPRCSRPAVIRSPHRAASAPRSAIWRRTTGAGTCSTRSGAPTGSATR